MKKTLFLLSALAILSVLLFLFTTPARTSNTDTCCQKFEIVSAGTPLTGCKISIANFPGPVAECIPDINLQCTICNLTVGNTYTAIASCDGKRTGSTSFVACSSKPVIIYVP